MHPEFDVSSKQQLPSRRSFLAASVAGSTLAAIGSSAGHADGANESSTPTSDLAFELNELSIDELQRGMERRENTLPAP